MWYITHDELEKAVQITAYFELTKESTIFICAFFIVGIRNRYLF